MYWRSSCEAFHAQFDQQRLVIGKMAIGRGMADAGAPRHRPQGQRAQRLFFQDGARRIQQAVAQIAMMIGRVCGSDGFALGAWPRCLHCSLFMTLPLCAPCAHIFLPREQAGRIPALAAQTFDFRIKLIHQRRHRQADAVAARFVQADAEILAHPFHREAVIILARRHGLVAVLHLPALRRALGDHLHHRLDVQARGAGEAEAFRQALHHAGDADLVDHLGELARARTGPAAAIWRA